MAVVDDDRRHRIDAELLPVTLARAHLGGVLVRGQDGPRAFDIHAEVADQTQQHPRRAGVQRLRVIGGQQRVLEFALAPFEAGPVQQPVRIEGVPDPRPLAEAEADFGAALADRLAHLRHPLRRRAVLLGQVGDRLAALGRQRRIQLEGLEVQLDRQRVTDPRQRGLEPVQADCAPGAGDVRDEVDLHACSSRSRSS